MTHGQDPLPLRRGLAVAHEVVDVVQQGLRLGEVTVAKPIDVEVGDRYCVEPGDHGVGDVVTGAGAS